MFHNIILVLQENDETKNVPSNAEINIAFIYLLKAHAMATSNYYVKLKKYIYQ